jgi:hypothetical protein
VPVFVDKLLGGDGLKADRGAGFIQEIRAGPGNNSPDRNARTARTTIRRFDLRPPLD